MLSPALFYDQILQRSIFQRHIRVHALKFDVFRFKLFQPLLV